MRLITPELVMEKLATDPPDLRGLDLTKALPSVDLRIQPPKIVHIPQLALHPPQGRPSQRHTQQARRDKPVSSFTDYTKPPPAESIGGYVLPNKPVSSFTDYTKPPPAESIGGYVLPNKPVSSYTDYTKPPPAESIGGYVLPADIPDLRGLNLTGGRPVTKKRARRRIVAKNIEQKRDIGLSELKMFGNAALRYLENNLPTKEQVDAEMRKGNSHQVALRGNP